MLLVDHFGSIRDTIQSNVAATIIEEMEKHLKEPVNPAPNVKSVNSPFKEIVSSLVFVGEVSEDLHWTQEREVLRLCQFQRHR